jgi:DNA-binding beta-propeller fold protein YncE
VLASCDLGGQPDSVAVAPDGSFVAVAIENERDEDLGDGRVPQMPAGFVAIVPTTDGASIATGMISATSPALPISRRKTPSRNSWRSTARTRSS